MKNTINRILAVCAGLILIGCNSGGSSATPANPTPPTVSLTSPTPITNVSVNPTITLAFSEAVSGVNTNTIQFQTQGGPLENITITPSGNNYTLTTGVALVAGTQYVVLVNSGITSTATAAPVAPKRLNFTTKIPGLLTVLGTVATTGTNPTGISISPNGANVYVTSFSIGRISQYRRNSNGILTAIGNPVATGTNPQRISVSPDGLNAYVTNSGSTNVSQYSRDASGILTVIGTVATENNPYGISISPDGKNVYVTNFDSNTISQYSRAITGVNVGQLTPIGTDTPVATGNGPVGISISSDGNNV